VGDAANAQLGVSVALSADARIMAVGASSYNGQTGYVKVYHTNDDGENWAQLGQTIYGKATNDDFGESVDITPDGMTIVCGSPGWSSDYDRPGYVRVFSLEGDSDLGTDSWKQIGQDIIGEADGDQFGYVSISDDGKTIAVGASENDGIIGYGTGHVRIHRLVEDGTSWEQIGQDIDGEAASDGLGWSVSLSADGLTIAIGAPFNNNNGLNSGQVTVRRFNGEKSNWELLGQSIYGDNADDISGWSVALSPDGNTLAIGSPGYDEEETDRPGYVRVFSLAKEDDIDTDTWNQIGQDIVGDANGDEFGSSVALSYDGKTLAVGAPNADGKNGVDSGHVRVYRMDDSEFDWIQLGDDINGEAAYDYLGFSVSLSADGDKVATGSPGNDDNGEFSGHVSVLVLE
jgi:hypothetical protein